MKKLFIINEAMSSQGNGIGTYIRQMITCLDESEININLLVFNSDKETFEIEDNDCIQSYYFPSFPGRSIQNYSRVIDKFLRLYIPDSIDNIFLINYSPFSLMMETLRESHPLSRQIYVIHDMAWTLHLFGDMELYIRILKQKSRKNVVSEYSNILKWYKEEIRMSMYADKIVCLSEDTYNLLEKYYLIDKEKLCLIPNAIKQISPWSEVKKTVFREKMLLKADEKIILYVGRLTEQKGFSVYLEAFKEVIKVFPLCRLVIIGSADNWDYILRLCSPVSAKILFTGLLSVEELENWYQIADIGVLPSYTEQCSFVGLEMMAYGLPIVVSDGFGVRCMFQDEENVKVAKIGNRNCVNDFKKELIHSTLFMLQSNNKYCKSSLFTKRVIKDVYLLENVKIKYRHLFQLDT